MQGQDYIAIPLRRRDGSIRAYAKVSPEDAGVAKVRWSLNGDGYVKRSIPPRNGRPGMVVKLHRVILGLPHGDERQGDHINGDPLDCRRSNLRIVSGAQNSQNVPARANSSSLFRGVHWDSRKRRWIAQAGLGGRNYHIGAFTTESDAAHAARVWRQENMSHANEDRATA